MENLQLLIQTCPSYSCGATYDFVLGCLSKKWTAQFISDEKYLDYDPSDFQGPNSGRYGMFLLKNVEYIDVVFFNHTEIKPSKLSEFIHQLKEITIQNGYIGMSLGDHCWVVIYNDEKFWIIDSYVHVGETFDRKYDRKLGKRSFDFTEFEQLLKCSSVDQWNKIFDNHSTTIETDDRGMFQDLSISY